MIGKPEQKVYGLSFPTRTAKEKPKTLVESVLAAESDEEADAAQLKPLKVQSNTQSSHTKLHRKTKSDYEKAMEEDPSVFQYDEIYDDIRSEKDRQVNDILGGSKKESKYVGQLLKTAEERKLERELCLERKAQKEIEADAEQYGDKEAFVTSAYKEKLKQLQELVSKREEEQVREDYMDITKQQGLGGFYRYMYQHGMKSEETATASASASSRVDDQKHSQERVKLEQNDKTEKHRASGERHRSSKQDNAASESNNRSSRCSPKPRSSRDERSGMSSRDSHHSSRRSPTPRHESSRQREGAERDRTRSPKKPHSSDRHIDSGRPLDKSQRVAASETVKFPAESKNARPADPKGGSQQVQRQTSDPNYIYARPRVTTDTQLEEARQRYLARKAAGIHPVIVDSDSD
ncbi:hypothetical protein CRM22_000161 [Opisthorchis felineus]|uniref:Nuclear speckle splicing regulatory protein 1 N-terminal domain-containing protein n=1 Tax=Opisthorchis felineus TaxID=147828 RepID=A0A4S2ML51_OPIFE|nr:hypothetical protein CRM22_000161 [Opisthorchis felineus]